MSFFLTLKSLINDKIDKSEELNPEGAFCELCSDYLILTSAIPEFQDSYFYQEGDNNLNYKINGFCLNETEDVLNLFICSFNNSEIEENINKHDVVSVFKQLYRVLNHVIRQNTPDVQVPQAHVLSELNRFYNGTLRNNLIQINFHLLTNNNTVNRKEISSNDVLGKGDLQGNIDFNFRIIDLNELERLHKNNQNLDIEVSEYYDRPIQILRPKIGTLSYGTAIGILPGKFLFEIYKYYGSRLLESNVRSFLSSRVKVNVGIKETLINNPDMFLAYNNGLCITVSGIDLNDDGSVKTFRDFQIVNGGQTTSSIFFSKLEQINKRGKEVDLERVNVMAKITQIGRNIDSFKIQSRISKNSNLQTAVKESDLTSNEDFLINLHTLSKKYKNPTNNTYYYFERTRGQYNLEKDLSNNKNFQNLYPKNQMFDKSDISIIFFCGFSDNIAPYISVQSAEKRYLIINKIMEAENKNLDDDYYYNLVGSYILYQKLDKTHGVGNNGIGRIKKNVLAYGIGLIQHRLEKNGESIDFVEIWKKNATNIDGQKLKAFLKYINDLLLEMFNDGRLDEACKKEESWNKFIKKADEKIINEFITIIPTCKIKKRKKTNNTNIESDRLKFMIDEINLKISTVETYIIVEKCISNEIDSHIGDGMSKYGRNHKTMFYNHFRPILGPRKSFSPLTYELYVMDCKGVKKKLDEMKNKIEDLYRVFNAVITDENLIL